MAVIRKEAWYQSANGRNQIHTRIWADDAVAPLAVLQIAHGVAEHIGRYDVFARFLAERGIVVCGNDHIGHGKSVESVDELGYIDETDGYIYMVRDMNQLYRIMHKRYPALPYFLFGHSLGSFLARIYAASFGNDLAGLILCGTGQLPAFAGYFDAAIEDLCGRLGATEKENNYVLQLSNKLSAKFLGEKDELAWLSLSTANRDAYREDPLCGFPLQNAGAKNIALIGMKACAQDWAHKLPFELPVMLISGAKDPVGMSGRGVLAVSDQLIVAGLEPVVILYPGDRHEVLHEDDCERVFNDVSKFLFSVLQGTSFYD